jgi:hypothetical protein
MNLWEQYEEPWRKVAMRVYGTPRKICVNGVYLCSKQMTWWLRVGSNHRPQHYECRALTS